MWKFVENFIIYSQAFYAYDSVRRAFVNFSNGNLCFFYHDDTDDDNVSHRTPSQNAKCNNNK